MSSLLEVVDLSYCQTLRKSWFTKPKQFILGPLSFKVEQGCTLAITGNNGSGKTLLAKLLCAGMPSTSGDILINGENIKHSSQRARNTNIRLMLQHSNSAMNPAVTVGRMLEQTLTLNTDLNPADRREKIEFVLVRVGLLREHFYFYKHMLSDGQQQRVALARAMILDPKVIVADEPFAALDPSVRSQTVNLILELQQELGLTFVFISQNLGIVRHISDDVMVLDKGEIVEYGATSTVFKSPQHPLTQKLIDSHFSLVEKHFA